MLKILIIEDDDATRSILNYYICGERGQYCDEADSYRKAMEMIQNKRYDIILLDLWINGDFGIGLIEETRKLYQDGPPIIIVISAMTGGKEIAERHKADKFVAKPFDLEIMDEFISDNNLLN